MQSILVCDDDKQIVEAIDIYLTGEGFEVIKAYDGAEALHRGQFLHGGAASGAADAGDRSRRRGDYHAADVCLHGEHDSARR